MSAPLFWFTDEAQLPSASKFRNAPGHKPSFPLSMLIIMSPRPPYSHAPFLPPATTPWPTWVIFRSKVTPFSASWLRRPHQAPVRAERDHISPEYGPWGDVSCASTLAPRNIPNRKRTVKAIEDLFIGVTPILI